MTIGTDATIDFFGTEDEVTVASPGAVNAGAFSAAADVSDWTNDDDAPYAMFKLKLTASGLTGAPTAGETVVLYARLLNIESTEDAPVPDSNYRQIRLTSFVLDAADADQVHVRGPIRLPNYKTSQEYEFFIENNMASINIGASGWELWVKPITFGPHA